MWYINNIPSLDKTHSTGIGSSNISSLDFDTVRIKSYSKIILHFFLRFTGIYLSKYKTKCITTIKTKLNLTITQSWQLINNSLQQKANG